MSNVWECFHSATLELVRSTPIKSRLTGAFRRYLADLKEEQIPREARANFIKVVQSLSSVKPLPGEDPVAASVRKMSNHEADECAAMIVEIYGAMNGATQVPVKQTASIVPLHPDIDIPATIASVSRA